MPPTPRITAEPLTVIAELRFDPAHREALLELAQRHVRNTLAAEPGCLRFELVAPKDDRRRCVFCEMFASEAAFAAHRALAACGLVPRGAGALRPSRPTSRELRPVAPRRCRARSFAAATCWRSYPQDLRAAGAKPGSRSAGTSSAAMLTEDELIERLDGVVATIAGLEPYTEARPRGGARRSRWSRGSASATRRSTSRPRRGTGWPWRWRSAPTMTRSPTTPSP